VPFYRDQGVPFDAVPVGANKRRAKALLAVLEDLA